jgi:hypothetical protein
MIMHLTTLCTPCIAFMLVSHTCIIVIGHKEQGPEETPESAPIEAGNYEQDQGKPRLHYDNFRSILVTPITRYRSLAMARRRCRR